MSCGHITWRIISFGNNQASFHVVFKVIDRQRSWYCYANQLFEMLKNYVLSFYWKQFVFKCIIQDLSNYVQNLEVPLLARKLH